MPTYTAFRIHKDAAGHIAGRLEQLELAPPAEGEVQLRLSHSGINYKDALAATGAGQILRRFPLVGGIDCAGVVAASRSPLFREGDAVLCNGSGMSEVRDGGYAQYVTLPAELVVPMPPGLDALQAMALGTAGFTAALALVAMERNGQSPAQGDILVTGATGGVGCWAIDLFSARGYRVVALSGKTAESGFLLSIGAAEVLDRAHWQAVTAPLASPRWAGAVDNLGGQYLADVLAQVQLRGNVASIGLASGSALPTTVMPFILRGVNLLGSSSANTPPAARRALWARLGADLKPRHFARIAATSIALADLPGAFDAYLKGRVRGRTVVLIP